MHTTHVHMHFEVYALNSLINYAKQMRCSLCGRQKTGLQLKQCIVVCHSWEQTLLSFASGKRGLTAQANVKNEKYSREMRVCCILDIDIKSNHFFLFHYIYISERNAQPLLCIVLCEHININHFAVTPLPPPPYFMILNFLAVNSISISQHYNE